MSIDKAKRLKNGRTYAATLKDVVAEYDPINQIAIVAFIYTVYITPWITVEVKDCLKFYENSLYFSGTRRKINKLFEKYEYKIARINYRNEIVFANACKGLIGYNVEIEPFNYMGEQKYKVLNVEKEIGLRAFSILNLEVNIVRGKSISMLRLMDLSEDEVRKILEDRKVIESPYLNDFLEKLEIVGKVVSLETGEIK